MVEYVVPLSKFERQILEDIQCELDYDYGYTLPVTTIFGKWKWSSLVRSYLDYNLKSDTIQKDYQGDKKKAYDAFIHTVSHFEDVEQSLSRAQDLERTNEDFLLRLENSSIGEDAVDVTAHEDDIQSWLIVARLYELVGQEREFEDTFMSSNGTFDIWQLVRKFMIKRISPNNKDDVDRALVQDNTFLSITRKKTGFSPEKWPEDKPRTDENGEISQAYVIYLLQRVSAKQQIEDPRGYLHFIPGDELDLTDETFLRKSGINLDIPFVEEEAIIGWALWTPPYQGFAWNHHLHTEDEVFEYNIVKRWPFPDHFLAGKVIFAVRVLDQTDFIMDLDSYWDFWNDCAITQITSDGPPLLLETIPGMRFRSRIKQQDKVAALEYFRNLVEAHQKGPSVVSKARDMIGLEASYNPLFEYSLRIIPENQLHDIAWNRPLGRGKNGAVYSAVWDKPAGYLATSVDKKQDVVLKDVASRSSVAKLVKELDVTFASLGGRAVGCIQFLGVAIINRAVNKDNEMRNKNEMFLVFEKASQGTVLDFLSRQIKDVTFRRSWYFVINVLTSICGGISSLHEHRVLHRDLHLNNILVTDRVYPTDLEYSYEYEYLISDLGEGKILSAEREIRSSFDARASYGALEFRAPEVQGSTGWSPEAEVFSFGVIATKIMECRGYICSSSPPESILSGSLRERYGTHQGQNPYMDPDTDIRELGCLLPTALRDAIEPCLSHDPANRPSLKDVVRRLENAGGQFWGEDAYSEETDIEWTYWEWKKSLRRGFNGEVNARHLSGHGSRRGFCDSQVSDDFDDFDDISTSDD